MTSVPAPPGHPAPPDRPLGAGGGDRIPPWPGWSAPAALLAAFAAALVCAVIIGVLAAPFGASFDDAPASVTILSTIAQDACFIAAALFFARIVAPPRKAQFGLQPPRNLKRAIAFVVVGYLLFIGLSAAWLAIIGQSDTKDTIIEDLGAGDSTVALIAVTFIVCVCAPLAEEFLFRGYIFGALRSNGFWTAALLTGLMFGLVHVLGSPIAFILPLAFLGAALCFIREQTQSIYPCMALHCVNNTLALSSNQDWSWQVPVALLASLAVIAGAIWLGVRHWPWSSEPMRANPVGS
jgi:membrane protease YdiL (CAAX protease family)